MKNNMEKQKNRLIEISDIDPSIPRDIRYATANNFLGFAAYSKPACYLRLEVALAVSQAQKELMAQGLSLKLFDGYRPLSIQQLMWDRIQDERYVSNPAKNKGRHTRGTAIDLTIVDLHGNELEMPTEFDDFSEKAHSDALDITAIAKKNRELLKRVMEKQNFIQLPFEWWHFDYTGWNNDEKYPALDYSFEELEKNK